MNEVKVSSKYSEKLGVIVRKAQCYFIEQNKQQPNDIYVIDMLSHLGFIEKSIYEIETDLYIRIQEKDAWNFINLLEKADLFCEGEELSIAKMILQELKEDK